MLETYELYMTSADRARAFVPLMCLPSEVMSRAREEMERVGAEDCEVECAGRSLFKLERAPQPRRSRLVEGK